MKIGAEIKCIVIKKFKVIKQGFFSGSFQLWWWVVTKQCSTCSKGVENAICPRLILFLYLTNPSKRSLLFVWQLKLLSSLYSWSTKVATSILFMLELFLLFTAPYKPASLAPTSSPLGPSSSPFCKCQLNILYIFCYY